METIIEKRILNFHLDSLGMLHHGRYLEFFEEGRWDYCFRNGLLDEFLKRGLYHVVVNVTVDYWKKALFGDTIAVATAVHGVTERSVIFRQQASRDGTRLAGADVTNVFLYKADGATAAVKDMISFWEDLRRLQK